MAGFIPERVLLAILGFFGFMNLYLVRFSFSIITVSMITDKNSLNCSKDMETCTTEFSETNTFDWDERTRGLLLGFFFYGYAITQIPGGRLSEIYGTKIVFGISVLIPGLLGFLIPKLAEYSYWLVIVIRFLQGIFQGMSWPSMYAVFGTWIPPQERARFMSIVFFASTLSMVYIMPFSGYLCDAYSWQVAIYVISIMPIIWSIFWFMLMHSTPSSNPRISKEEQDYIETNLKVGGSTSASRTVPWKAIMTSVPFIALLLSAIASDYTITIFMAQLPNYLKSVFGYHLAKTGFLAGVPFLARYIGSVLFGFIADHLISRNILTIATTRRIFSVTALLIPGTILAALILFGMNTISMFVAFTCAYTFLNGSVTSSTLINATDLSPNFAGTLFGIINCMGSVSGFISMLVIGEILNVDPDSPGTEGVIDQWKIIFGTCVPFLILTEIFYLFFMSGTPQDWNFHEKSSKTETPDKIIEEQQL